MKDFDLSRCNLYAILDMGLVGEKNLVEVAEKLIRGGVDLIQYRDKISRKEEVFENAKKLSQLDFPLVVNDYPDIAQEINAVGVHLGQEDLDTFSARKIVGNGKIIGRSVTSFAEALKEEKYGADYIGVGPVFKTLTKTDADLIDFKSLNEIANNIKIPVFAIGGITLYNINLILDAGIKRVAVASALTGCINVSEVIKLFVEILNRK
jgi:thiamine-phosphate pyrophosphorylase